jgi:hypothetical protein
MVFAGRPQTDQILLVFEEFSAQEHTPILIVFAMLHPVFVVALVEPLERTLQILLHEVEKGLFR